METEPLSGDGVAKKTKPRWAIESLDSPTRLMLKNDWTMKPMGGLFLSQARALIGTTIGVTWLHDGIDKVPAALGDNGRAFFERFH